VTNFFLPFDQSCEQEGIFVVSGKVGHSENVEVHWGRCVDIFTRISYLLLE